MSVVVVNPASSPVPVSGSVAISSGPVAGLVVKTSVESVTQVTNTSLNPVPVSLPSNQSVSVNNTTTNPVPTSQTQGATQGTIFATLAVTDQYQLNETSSTLYASSYFNTTLSLNSWSVFPVGGTYYCGGSTPIATLDPAYPGLFYGLPYNVTRTYRFVLTLVSGNLTFPQPVSINVWEGTAGDIYSYSGSNDTLGFPQLKRSACANSSAVAAMQFSNSVAFTAGSILGAMTLKSSKPLWSMAALWLGFSTTSLATTSQTCVVSVNMTVIIERP